jgi:hypothetical protein
MALSSASSGSQPCRNSKTLQQCSSKSSTTVHKRQEVSHKRVMRGGCYVICLLHLLCCAHVVLLVKDAVWELASHNCSRSEPAHCVHLVQGYWNAQEGCIFQPCNIFASSKLNGLDPRASYMQTIPGIVESRLPDCAQLVTLCRTQSCLRVQLSAKRTSATISGYARPPSTDSSSTLSSSLSMRPLLQQQQEQQQCSCVSSCRDGGLRYPAACCYADSFCLA